MKFALVLLNVYYVSVKISKTGFKYGLEARVSRRYRFTY